MQRTGPTAAIASEVSDLCLKSIIFYYTNPYIVTLSL
jgi:hypothetical protein